MKMDTLVVNDKPKIKQPIVSNLGDELRIASEEIKKADFRNNK